MDGITRKINELINEYEQIEKEYMVYLEADMNKEARKLNNKMHKITEQINKLTDQRDYGLKEDMKRKIDLYEKFITQKCLRYEFNNFLEEEEEQEI